MDHFPDPFIKKNKLAAKAQPGEGFTSMLIEFSGVSAMLITFYINEPSARPQIGIPLKIFQEAYQEAVSELYKERFRKLSREATKKLLGSSPGSSPGGSPRSSVGLSKKLSGALRRPSGDSLRQSGLGTAFEENPMNSYVFFCQR